MNADNQVLDLTFVIIGFNESASIGSCIESCKKADLDGLSCEFIYVDGGSADDSMTQVESVGVTEILGGERPRKAAENRNLGLEKARGVYVQFVDGDMVLDPVWPKAAVQILEAHDDAGVVCGRLHELNQNVFYQALQIDWQLPEGPTLYCGGAAMFKRDPLIAAGGFPEDVTYGEEPLLCWRLRNDVGVKIYHTHRLMAHHDLAYKGFLDYWKRNIRVGESYAEIAHRCKNTADPFWSGEVRSKWIWGSGILVWLLLLLFVPTPLKMIVIGLAFLIWIRKFLQCLINGNTALVAGVYAVHTYLAKTAISYGVVKWHLKNRR